MRFNSTQPGGASGYLAQAGMAPDMTMTGTFDPVKQIGTGQNTQSAMAQGALKASGELAAAVNKADTFLYTEKLKADLAAAQGTANASNRMAGAIFDGISTLGSAAIGLGSSGGGGGTQPGGALHFDVPGAGTATGFFPLGNSWNS